MRVQKGRHPSQNRDMDVFFFVMGRYLQEKCKFFSGLFKKSLFLLLTGRLGWHIIINVSTFSKRFKFVSENVLFWLKELIMSDRTTSFMFAKSGKCVLVSAYRNVFRIWFSQAKLGIQIKPS